MQEYIDCVLVDVQDMKVITREKISTAECDSRNDEARQAGEVFLQWLPACSFGFNA